MSQTEITKTQVLDARGLLCPMPIVKTAKAMKELEPGDVLKVMATDRGSIADVPAWADDHRQRAARLARGGRRSRLLRAQARLAKEASMADQEKLVIMVTHGPDEPELATIPFVMAGAAVASDVDVVMGFQGDGCTARPEGRRRDRRGAGVRTARRLAPTHPRAGRAVPRLLAVHQEPRDRGRPRRRRGVVAAARFVAEITSATNSLVY